MAAVSIFNDHFEHKPDLAAGRLVLASLACRDTEPGFEQSRETFGMMLDAVLDGAGDCRWCLRGCARLPSVDRRTVDHIRTGDRVGRRSRGRTGPGGHRDDARGRADARRQRAAMAAKYPACRHCRRPVCCGQTDAWGVPAHLGCAGRIRSARRRSSGPPMDRTTSGRKNMSRQFRKARQQNRSDIPPDVIKRAQQPPPQPRRIAPALPRATPRVRARRWKR